MACPRGRQAIPLFLSGKLSPQPVFSEPIPSPGPRCLPLAPPPLWASCVTAVPPGRPHRPLSPNVAAATANSCLLALPPAHRWHPHSFPAASLAGHLASNPLAGRGWVWECSGLQSQGCGVQARGSVFFLHTAQPRTQRSIQSVGFMVSLQFVLWQRLRLL